jgi:hypothetical protein
VQGRARHHPAKAQLIAAKLLERDEARRTAANIAKLIVAQILRDRARVLRNVNKSRVF